MLKIDTQGHESEVLAGALQSITRKRFEYVQYEFSPLLMRRAVSRHTLPKASTPSALLNLLPQLGAVCFDMMGESNKLPHPTAPLDAYLAALDSGKNSECEKTPGNTAAACAFSARTFGYWEDILCYFPQAAGAVANVLSE